MSQDYVDNVFVSTEQVQANMAQIEDNFAALKSAFSGVSAPSDPVAGMWWLDTTNHILKVYGESSAWLSVWDMANNKPILSSLSGDITGAMIAAAAKDPAAATAGLRTLGTGALTACAGNDARLSDTRTPPDASVTAVKLPAYTAGNYCMAKTGAKYVSEASYTKKGSIYMPRAGTVRTRIGGAATVDETTFTWYNEDFTIVAGDTLEIWGYMSSTTIYLKVYKNGGALGTQRTIIIGAVTGYCKLIIGSGVVSVPGEDISYA